MQALYHRPGIHYHAELDFNGQFPLRLCVWVSSFFTKKQQGALLVCASFWDSFRKKKKKRQFYEEKRRQMRDGAGSKDALRMTVFILP